MIENIQNLDNNLFRKAIETSPAFFVLIDMHGKTIMMNKSLLDALGYQENEVQGESK